jgi:molybdopterin molybdotransferase
MISVSEALDALFALANPLDIETVALSDAAGRVLAVPAVAERDQPPFPASAMDGYALNSAGAITGATYQVIGESAAGHGYNAPVPTGACVRIFTVRQCREAVIVSSFKRMLTAAGTQSR